MTKKVKKLSTKRLKSRPKRTKTNALKPIINPGLSLLEAVYSNIDKEYSPFMADMFMKNPEFSNYKQYDDKTQRGLVNRVLISKLLVFRASSDVKVVEIIYCLIPDGDNESWMNVFKLVILPFLKENKVSL